MKRNITYNKKMLSGVVVLFVLYLFYMYLGDKILVSFHDQLDSEVIYYKLRSQSIYTVFQTRFQQMMNGNADVSVVSLGTLLLYVVLSPLNAFITNMFFVRIVAFCGMFCLLTKYHTSERISLIVALTYALLPIYSVYGLSSMGLPLVWIGLKNIKDGTDIAVSYFIVTLYALFSSLVTTGYYVIFLSAVYVVITGIQDKRNGQFKKKRIFQLLLAVVDMGIVYMICNFNVINSVLNADEFTSHKSEYKLVAEDFYRSFSELLINGQYHAVSLHKWILISCLIGWVVSVIVSKLCRCTGEAKENSGLIALVIFAIVAIALFHGIFKSNVGVHVRNSLFQGSPLIGMQFDRVYWCYPTLWYVLWALVLSNVGQRLKEKVMVKRIMVFLMCLLPVSYVVYSSDITENIIARVSDDADLSKSWENGYKEELFAQIDRYIGEDKSTYRVISVGLHPAVAQYNGFYTLDGYSNNYDLKYKHSFGAIINEELKDDQEIYDYFWDWGNRCYAFSSDIGKNIKNAYVDKTIHLAYDFSEFKKNGGQYIISVAQLDNSELIFDAEFADSDSNRLFLYELR